MTIEDILAAHEIAYGCPDYWRCGCGFESDRTDGRASINEHRADAIRAHLLSPEVVQRASMEVDTPHGIHGRATARNVLTAATEDHQ